MARKGAGIVIKVKEHFRNESNFSNMSYFACGDLILKDSEIEVIAWKHNDDVTREVWEKRMAIAPDYHRDIKTGRNTRKLGTCEIEEILNVLFKSIDDEDWIMSESALYCTKREICTLVYVESLLNRGLVEVEWYDWW